MRLGLKPWQLAALVVAISCAIVGIVRWRKGSVTYDAAHMVAALPSEHAIVFYADVAALRQAGILDLLAGSKAAEEAEYQKFVDEIGFDYRTDLNAVAAAFLNGSSYLTVRGRFQWKQLADYAKAGGGVCRYAICYLPTATPGRRISFYPLQPDVLAVAATSDPLGVEMIAPAKRFGPVASEPLWISAPSAALAKPGALPPSLSALASLAQRSERVTLAVGPRGQSAVLLLTVTCKSPEDASKVKADLDSTANALKNAATLDRPAAPGDPDWAGFLRGGSVTESGLQVTGSWPLERSFLSALLSAAAR